MGCEAGWLYSKNVCTFQLVDMIDMHTKCSVVTSDDSGSCLLVENSAFVFW